MPRHNLRLVESARRRREERKRTAAIAKSEVQWTYIQSLLRRTHRYPEIRVCHARQVIGEKFNHARLAEAIVTFRFQNPQLVDLDFLEDILRTTCARRDYSTRSIFQRINYYAENYRNARKRVRNREWKS